MMSTTSLTGRLNDKKTASAVFFVGGLPITLRFVGS